METNTFLMMGRPGSGKGTQTKLLAEKIGAEVFSPGNLLRTWAADGSVAGEKLRDVMVRGDLIPSWVLIYLFEAVLLKLAPDRKIVFESSCRIEPEARAFNEVNTWLGRSYRVIHIDVGVEVAKQRILNRRKFETREDDAIAVIDQRLEEFRTKTIPSLEYFRSIEKLTEVDGEQAPEKVFEDIIAVLGAE